MCYSNVISSDFDTQAIILSIICTGCSLCGLFIAISLDREENGILTIDSYMDRLPSYNKQVLKHAQAIDAIVP